MELENQTDHIAMLTLMMVGTLIKRLQEVGQLDEATRRHLHHLVRAVRIRAENAGHSDLRVLFDNLDRALDGEAKTLAD